MRNLGAWALDGCAVDLLRGLDTDAPPRPFGGIEAVLRKYFSSKI